MMRAFGFLVLLVAIFIIVNAINIRELIQGKIKLNVSKNTSG